MLKIAAIIAIHGREAITLKSVIRLRQQSHPLSQIILVGETPAERALAEMTDSTFIEHPNTPLGAKWQAGINYVRSLGVDGILIIGSDDWLTPNWVKKMVSEAKRGYELIGKKSIYFLHFGNSDKKLLRWNGYPEGDIRFGEPIGAGRVFMNELLNRMDWQLFPAYLNGGLDKASYFLTLAHQGNIKIVEEEDVQAMDLKSIYWTNKWSYDQIAAARGVTHIANTNDFLQKYFPDTEEWIKPFKNFHEKSTPQN